MTRFFFSWMLMIPAGVNGQAEFGIKAGLNFADIVMTNYVNPDVESDLTMKLGLHAGFFVNNQMSDDVRMAAELLYSNKGVKGISNINLHYITVPLLIQYRLTDHIAAEIGPEPGYMLAADSKYGNVANTYNNKFDLALNAGFRLDFQKLLLGLRYSAGVFSVRAPLENSAYPGEKVKYQNRVLQLSVGYKMWMVE